MLQLIKKFGHFERIYYICLLLNMNVSLIMLANYLLFNFLTIPLITEFQFVVVLVILVLFFGIVLLLGVRKSYLLKKENKRLEKMNTTIKDNEDYKDFTGGHMYGGN